MTGPAARTYHDQTKHTWRSVRADTRAVDWATQPVPFKLYPQLEPIALPIDLAEPDWPALDSLSGEPPPNVARVDLSWLAAILFHAGGITRRWRRDGRTIHFRAAASAGALYPIEIYVVCGEIGDLPAGVYHFEPYEFALRRLREGDQRAVLARAAVDETVAATPVNLVLTAIPGRSTWKYGPRGYRHVYWDAGTIVANLLAVALGSAQPARVLAGFIDGDVSHLLGTDDRVELPLAIVPVGAPEAHSAAVPAATPPIDHVVEPLGGDADLDDLVRRVHDQGRHENAATVKAWREQLRGLRLSGTSKVRDIPLLSSFDTVADVIVRRGSTRRFQQRPLTEEQLHWPLAVSAQPVPADWVIEGDSLLTRFLAVNDVAGVESGAYWWAPYGIDLVRPGQFRGEAATMCLEQALAGDASAVVFHATPLHRVLERGGVRSYRAAQLEAGIALGRLQLATTTLGLGSTGLTFYDDDVPKFFEVEDEPLTVGAWGVPAYEPRPGGRPRDVPPVRLRRD